VPFRARVTRGDVLPPSKLVVAAARGENGRTIVWMRERRTGHAVVLTTPGGTVDKVLIDTRSAECAQALYEYERDRVRAQAARVTKEKRTYLVYLRGMKGPIPVQAASFEKAQQAAGFYAAAYRTQVERVEEKRETLRVARPTRISPRGPVAGGARPRTLPFKEYRVLRVGPDRCEIRSVEYLPDGGVRMGDEMLGTCSCQWAPQEALQAGGRWLQRAFDAGYHEADFRVIGADGREVVVDTREARVRVTKEKPVSYRGHTITLSFEDGDWIAKIAKVGDREGRMPEFGLQREVALSRAKAAIDRMIAHEKAKP
jgi:hypothetical protein